MIQVWMVILGLFGLKQVDLKKILMLLKMSKSKFLKHDSRIGEVFMVTVVGLGLGAGSVNPEVLEAVKKAEVLAGAERHLALFAENPAKRLQKGNLESFLGEVIAYSKTSRVVVLASGDPGFYGVAYKLAQRLPQAELEIICNVSSFQAAFARLKLSWVGARVVCMHGGRIGDLFPALLDSDKVAVLNDHIHTPARVAELLLKRGQAGWQAWVLEDLGSDLEKMGSWELEQLRGRDFSRLSMMVLLRKKPLPVLTDPEKGREIRAAILANLNLAQNECFWDFFNPDPYLALLASRRLGRAGVVAFSLDQKQEKELIRLRALYGAANLDLQAPGQGAKTMENPGAMHLAGKQALDNVDLKDLWQRLGKGGRLTVSCRSEASHNQALAQIGGLSKDLHSFCLTKAQTKPTLQKESCFVCLTVKG